MADPRQYAGQILGAASGSLYAAQTNAGEVAESERFLSRLRSTIGTVAELASMSRSAADKIVGSEPPDVKTDSAPSPPAVSFLHALDQLTGEIDRAAASAQHHLTRLHRAF